MSKIEFGSSFSDVHLITSLFVSKNSKLNNINTFGANLITMGYVLTMDVSAPYFRYTRSI